MSFKKKPERSNVFEGTANKIEKLFLPFFLETNLTPNQVTIISGMFGILGSLLLLLDNIEYKILSFLFIVFFLILDLIDGDIARVKGKESLRGHWLDLFFDKLVESLFLFILYYKVLLYHDLLTQILFPLIVIFHFLIQFLLLANDLYFNKNKNIQLAKKIKKEKEKRKSVFAKFIKFVNLHFSLKHVSLLIILSLANLFSQLSVGVYIVTAMGLFTLIFLIAYNFVALDYE